MRTSAMEQHEQSIADFWGKLRALCSPGTWGANYRQGWHDAISQRFAQAQQWAAISLSATRDTPHTIRAYAAGYCAAENAYWETWDN